MPKTDARVDAYIAKAAPFAQPILKQFRAIVHEACPEVVETIKWSVPAFDHRGMLCSMAAFREHCRLALWKGGLLEVRVAGMEVADDGRVAMFPRVRSVDDLPSDAVLMRLIKQAAQLNEQGTKPPARARSATRDVEVPDFFMAALRRNTRALAAFNAFPPSHRREYVEWITGAKREETRRRRIEIAIAQIVEGKSQNWKYAK
jgi:hypothetical protein